LGHRKHGSPGYTIFHIALNKIVFSSDVTFDESELNTRSNKEDHSELDTLHVDAVSRHIEDFKWLEGMAYRDEEQMYITTRVVTQQGFIVTYRALLFNDVVGVEETRPVHAADVEKLTKLYTTYNDLCLSTGDDTAGLHRISRTIDEGGEESTAGPAMVRPMSGSEGNCDESSSRAAEGGPTGAASVETTKQNSSGQPYGRPVPATDVQATPTTEATGEGQPPARSRATSGQRNIEDKPSRARRHRVPLNIGVLGDIEKIYHFSEEAHDFEVQWSDPDLMPNKDTLLYDDIMKTKNPAPWLAAGKAEAEAIIIDNNVFESCELPRNTKPLDTKWVFKRKQDADHSWRHKGRLCVKGFLQRWGVNFYDTFAPTAKWISLRIFLSICACERMFTRQLDVKTAFLYAELKEDVYIKVPKGMSKTDNPFNLSKETLWRCRGPYLKLLKSLYGLKQAPREWYLLLRSFFERQGFTNLKTETCIFVKYVNNHMIIALVFVDDILIACTLTHLLDDLVMKFAKEFKIKDSGEVNLYLSINISIAHRERAAYLDQTDYILAMWTRFQGVESRAVRSPFIENWRIHPDEERDKMTDKDHEYARTFPYRELVGSLLFISMCTRGDIAYHVSYLSRFLELPPKSACLAAKRVLQYLYNTRDRKLILGGVEKPLLTLFCDTDWAACPETRKSVECYMLFMGHGCIMWNSKQQRNVAQSTAEAEYCCLTPGVNMVRWTRNVTYELGRGYRRATAVYTDNTTAQGLVANPIHHSRMKQMHLKYLGLRDISEKHVIVCGRINTKSNPADLGTKPLGGNETESKSSIFFNGLSTLDYELIERPLTEPNDYSV
jgi:hypothetical protein